VTVSGCLTRTGHRNVDAFTPKLHIKRERLEFRSLFFNFFLNIFADLVCHLSYLRTFLSGKLPHTAKYRGQFAFLSEQSDAERFELFARDYFIKLTDGILLYFFQSVFHYSVSSFRVIIKLYYKNKKSLFVPKDEETPRYHLYFCISRHSAGI
jgi:hypothetical protein